MGFNTIRSFFFKQADRDAATLSNATDNEVTDMTKLIVSAIKHGHKIAPKMPDDPGTAVSATVLASVKMMDPENAARMAWANQDLGL